MSEWSEGNLLLSDDLGNSHVDEEIASQLNFCDRAAPAGDTPRDLTTCDTVSGTASIGKQMPITMMMMVLLSHPYYLVPK